MKIAFIGQKGIPSTGGGVEKHVEELAVSLAANGHSVLAYTRPHYTDKNLSEYRGIKLVSLPSISLKNLDAISHTFFAVLDLVRRDVDIVHFHGIGPSSLLWLAKIIKPRSRVVGTFHCQDYYHKKWSLFARLYLKFGEWVLCTKADTTIAVSHSLAHYANLTYGRSVTYIPNGVYPIDFFEAKEIKKWGLEKDNYIVAISRLIPHKGLHHLIKAFKSVETDKKLVIVGEGSYTDSYVNELQSLAALDSRVIMTGAQKGATLQELFSNAALFVQPSEYEGLSIALLEAMSCGCPVLVSDIPENLEAVGNTGFSFTCNNVSDLSKKIQMLITSDQLTVMGRAGKERVEEKYNWINITKATENVYEDQLSLEVEKELKHAQVHSRFSTSV